MPERGLSCVRSVGDAQGKYDGGQRRELLGRRFALDHGERRRRSFDGDGDGDV
jgi:hypothetical protein